MAKFFPNLKSNYRCLILLLSCGWSCTIILCLYFKTTDMPLTHNHVSKPAACVQRKCAPDREPTDWFCARYAPTVQLLLNSRNSELSANVSSWWTRLFGNRDANYTTLVKNLFQLLPDQEHNSDPHRCRTCAVVGNSRNLLGSRYGPFIDSKDFVMRINRGSTKGFEEDVGSKTTHRIFYPESVGILNNSTHLVFIPFKVWDFEWLIRVFTTKHTTKKFGYFPSTKNINKDKVDVFGFGATKDGTWHHYFDKTLIPYTKTNHPGEFEYETISRLHSEKKLFMHKGWT